MSASLHDRPIHAAVVGPDLGAQGGISTVADLWLGSSAWGDATVEYFPSMRDTGSALERALHMARQQARFVARLARGWRPDVVHVHLSYFTSFYRKSLYLTEAKALGIPVVAHVHAPDLEGFADARRLHGQALTRVFHAVDRVVVLSEAMAETVRDLTGPETRIEVIYNPVRLADFAREPRAPDAPPTCLFMGKVGDRKGTFDLAAAVPLVLERVPEARFVFGGNGAVEELAARLEALGVAGSCSVLGWVSGDAKRAAFAEASVYCLPSYHEGLPMSILEAMGGGLPVVSTPIAGIPESVVDGETGFLVAPGDVEALADRLCSLLGDPTRAQAMGAAGHALAADRFDVDVVVGEVRRLWYTLTQEAR